jgi:basic amino acid/polyamine antiporter, APA family
VGEQSRLTRQLGTGDAVVVGLGSMLGAGIFAALAPAAAAAGSGLLVGLCVAGAVAYANATSSAQLAALYPVSGGAYAYGRERLGAVWGYLAGWGFVVGKTASCAAMALTFGTAVSPSAPRVPAVLAIAGLTAVNLSGIRKTALTTRVIVTVVLGVLALVVLVALTSGAADLERLSPAAATGGLRGVLQSAGLLFFAFAGYARMATLGEEVRDPARSLRRAIPLALAAALVVYLLVALAALRALGPEVLTSATAPLADVVAASTFADLTAVVRIGAAVATVSVLLSVLVGVSRMTLAMARGGDLPAALTTIGSRGTPWPADLAGGAVAAVLAVLAGPAAAIALSAGCVLVYYAVTNAAAIRLHPDERCWPRWTSYLGFFLCLLLAFTLQVLTTALVLGVAVCVVALIARRRGGSVPGS